MNLEEKTKNRYWISKFIKELLIRVSFLEKEINDIGPGTPQNLQQTLDSGKSAQYDSNSSIEILAGVEDSRRFNLNINNSFTSGLGSQFFVNSFVGFLSSNIGDRTSQFYASNGRSEIRETYLTNTTVVNFLEPIANTTISYPAKPIGDYTLATLDDIITSPISGTFANPTSITVENGIITAIS
jgi:hypothetical protein